MDGPGVLIDDLQELNLDRPTKALKSSEELDRLTVDEKLTDIERAVYLLSSGQEVQRISVITTLPTLLKDSNEECMKRVVPKVREVLHVAQQDMQLAAATSFLAILQRKLVSLPIYTNTFLKSIVISVDNKDPESAAAWLNTLLSVIDLLPTDIIKSDILGIAINKGQLQQPVSVRLSCCKILGKIATKFDASIIKKEILPVVQQLCQDVEHEVRACMCSYLDSVAQGLGLENTKSTILPELRELTNDEESNVRIAGLDTIVNILPMLDNDTKTTTIVPLVCEFCEKAMHAEDSTMPAFATYIGKLCHGLKDILTDAQKQWFLEFYKKMCKVGVSLEKQKGPEKPPTIAISIESTLSGCQNLPAETRCNAAYNMPAMASLVKNFKTEMLPTLSALCKDPHASVRRTTASGFHEIAKLMGNQATLLFPDLIILLSDDSIEVLQGVVPGLPASLDVLSKTGIMSDSKVAVVQDVVNAFLSAEPVVFSSNSWRLQTDMMHGMECLGRICSQDVLCSQVIPILLSKMKNGRALPVRYAAARTLLILMRQLRRQDQRDQLTNILIDEFCLGQSCHSRALFIMVCKYFIELYSKAFFKEHLFRHVLPLTTDPVPNIRVQACGLLPSLKRLIKLPYDNDLKGSLEQCVRKLLISDERDRDVAFARTRAVDEMDKIPIQMESVVSRRKNFEDDVDDQVKEEEEKALLAIEEKERKEEEQRGTKGDKRTFKRDTLSSKPIGVKKSTGSKVSVSVSSKQDLGRKDSKGSTSSNTTATAAGTGSSLNKAKASTASQRPGNPSNPPSVVGALQRKGSTGSLPSFTAARRGSLGSAGSTNSEPSSSRGVKKIITAPTSPAAMPVSNRNIRKISKP